MELPRRARPISKQHFVFASTSVLVILDNLVVVITLTICKRIQMNQLI